MFLRYVIFCVYPWCDLLWNKFFQFQDIMWLVKSSWCVHNCSIHHFYWVSDRCRSGFALWWFFVRKKLSSHIGSFHLLLVLATECFFSLDIFKIHSAAFLVCYCVVGLLTVHGTTKLLILVFMFLKYVFFLCSSLMRFIVVQFFFLQDSVWLVKKSWWVHCCSNL